VIFESQEEHGLYRYLLTMLDGLESASAGRVCVIMTAMNVGSLPRAMVRSGRVELWLQTRLPDAEARVCLLKGLLAGVPAPFDAVDIELVAVSARGLTGADLKAVVEDGKLLFAHDLATGNAPRPAEDYFLEAIDTVRANQVNYARAKPGRLTGAAPVGFIA
jgi:ATP-dependent 26S proteasome regulatory subunit